MDYKEYHFTIQPLSPAREILSSELCDLDFDSFVDEEDGLKAYTKAEHQEDAFENLLAFNLEGVEITFEVKQVEDQNWNAQWESNFDPISIENKCLIRAPFHPKENGYDIEVLIQPQMSFGTGHHETTYLMCRELFGIEIRGKDVLDMGCGTGVLAIAAEKLGAAHCDAIDIDEWAYNNTEENLKLNETKKIDAFLGAKELLVSQQYDIILANINRNILLADMDAYRAVLKNGGQILFSGFYVVDMPMIREKAQELGLRFVSHEEKNNWVMMKFIAA